MEKNALSSLHRLLQNQLVSVYVCGGGGCHTPSLSRLRALNASSQSVWAQSQASLSSLLHTSLQLFSAPSQVYLSFFVRSTVLSQLGASPLWQCPASQFLARYLLNMSSSQRTAYSLQRTASLSQLIDSHLWAPYNVQPAMFGSSPAI
jgi:hypothetical protein